MVLLLALGAAEGAVHSVHHLTDPPATACCHVLSTIRHVPGVSPTTAAAAVPPAPTGARAFEPAPAAALRSQYPMMALMVGYTMVSLWIIAQPIVESSPGG